jgi:surface protein
MKPNGEEGYISDLPMEGDYYVLDMGETVYFKCGERNALFDHVFYCESQNDVSDCDGSTLSFTFTGTRVTFVENAYTSSSGKTSVAYKGTGVIDNGDGSYSYSTEKTLSGSMRTMFYGSATTMSEISCFPDTSNVDNMMMMFQDCSGLTYINTESFNTSKVTDMRNMFYNCPSLKEIDISGFDTTNVTNMYTMFGGCSSLTSIKTSEFDLQKCSNLSGMFFGCNSLINLDLSGWKLASNTDLSNFVNQCVNLKTLNVTGWNISKISKYSYFLKDCTSLNRLILGSVSQSTYDWWYTRLSDFSLQNQVTIEYSIV